MTLYYDDYRYVLSHNYINSYCGISFPEMILVLSRIRNYIYNSIDYQVGRQGILEQLNTLVNEIYNISMGSLLKFNIDSLIVEDRVCKISVSLYFNHFRVDPINLKLIVTI
jgi:hypothetical protein